MISRARPVATRVVPRRRWPLPLAAALILSLVIGRAAGPYLFRVATLQSEIATQVRLTTGLTISAQGGSRFDLLPLPHMTMTRIHVSDPSGSVRIDAASLRGEVRLLPLLVGRVELASATLVAPRIVIDLDGRPMPPESMIGRAMHRPAGLPTGGDRRLGSITLVDGSATLNRQGGGLPPLSDIQATLDWRNLNTAATITGTVRIGDTATDLAAWIEQPSALMRGDRSAAALRLHSIPLDLSATGDVVGRAVSFKGHVAASAPSLAALLVLCGQRFVLPAPFADMALNSDVSAARDAQGFLLLDLPNLRLGADGNSYEGTLAYRDDAAVPLLSGTLAAEQVAMAPFLSRLPPLSGPDHAWSTARIEPAAGMTPLRLDMRISIASLRLPPFVVGDAALSVLTRGDNLEIGINEGRLYGGTLKGRLSIGAASGAWSLRGAGAVTGVDAAALGWDLVGRQVATGTLDGSLAFDTAGASVEGLVKHAGGWIKARAVDGDFTGADLALGLRSIASGHPAEAASALRNGRTPFQTLTFDARIADGIATLGDASLASRDVHLDAGGTMDLTRRSLDLQGVASDARNLEGARLPIVIGGPVGNLTVGVDAPPDAPHKP